MAKTQSTLDGKPIDFINGVWCWAETGKAVPINFMERAEINTDKSEKRNKQDVLSMLQVNEDLIKLQADKIKTLTGIANHEKNQKEEFKKKLEDALIDFMGYVTLRKKPVTLSKNHDASIAVQLVEEYVKSKEPIKTEEKKEEVKK